MDKKTFQKFNAVLKECIEFGDIHMAITGRLVFDLDGNLQHLVEVDLAQLVELHLLPYEGESTANRRDLAVKSLRWAKWFEAKASAIRVAFADARDGVILIQANRLIQENEDRASKEAKRIIEQASRRAS